MMFLNTELGREELSSFSWAGMSSWIPPQHNDSYTFDFFIKKKWRQSNPTFPLFTAFHSWSSWISWLLTFLASPFLIGPLALEVLSESKQHRYHQTFGWKCRTVGPTLDLLNQRLHFNKIPRCSSEHQVWDVLLLPSVVLQVWLPD